MNIKYHHYFSENYTQARTRFLQSVEKHQGLLYSYPIHQQSPQQHDLFIDVARFGQPEAKQCLIISSGTHGVEGFFGSAAQLALLDTQLTDLLSSSDLAITLIHAVNPYGFAHLRRVNEENVDLNRNFVIEETEYSGAASEYGEMDPLLNPKSPPTQLEFFLLKAIFKIIKHGFSALKNSVAQGQYEYSKGLFYGGKQSSVSKQIIQQNLSQWIGNAQRIIHIDLHTGLGKWASYVLAASQNVPTDDLMWLTQYFDRDKVQNLESDGVLYDIRGEFTYFCRHLFAQQQDVAYYPILAEFGTYHILKVLQALRTENRATHWCMEEQTPLLQLARKNLKEAFIPSSKAWQTQVILETLRLFNQAAKALNSK